MMVFDSSRAESRNAKQRQNFKDFSSDFEKIIQGDEYLLLNLFWLEETVLSLSLFHPFVLHLSGRWKNSQNWTSACTGHLQPVQSLNDTALSSFCSSNTTRSWNELPGALFKWLANLNIWLFIYATWISRIGVFWVIASIKSPQGFYFFYCTSTLCEI